MDLKTFEHLALIPELLNKIDNLEDRLKLFTPILDNKKEVIKFLKICNTTYYNYLNNGIFIENKHFYKKDGKIIFIESEILKLRNEINRG